MRFHLRARRVRCAYRRAVALPSWQPRPRPRRRSLPSRLAARSPKATQAAEARPAMGQAARRAAATIADRLDIPARAARIAARGQATASRRASRPPRLRRRHRLPRRQARRQRLHRQARQVLRRRRQRHRSLRQRRRPRAHHLPQRQRLQRHRRRLRRQRAAPIVACVRYRPFASRPDRKSLPVSDGGQRRAITLDDGA
jgi:hypothetical protein